MEMPSRSPNKISPPPGDPMVTHVTHQAMATQFAVLLAANQADRVECVVEALEMLDEIESRLTIYSPASEVSQINRLAGQQWVKVSQPTFDLIERSMAWSRQTDGAFDITAGPLIEAWGFTTRSGRKPNAQEIESARHLVGNEKVLLNPGNRSIRFAVPGMKLNLGAIGKGDALDQIANRLLTVGITDFLIHGGASSLIAHGNQFPDSEIGWAVGIGHPSKPRHRLCGVWLHDTALATSGSGQQFFHHQGKRYGHVIDPRTGLPSGEFASLTVMMASATDADAVATGLYVAGKNRIANIDPSPAWVTVTAGERQDEMIVDASEGVVWVDDG